MDYCICLFVNGMGFVELDERNVERKASLGNILSRRIFSPVNQT